MSAHSEFNASGDTLLGVGWNPEPGIDRTQPPPSLTPWEVRMIEQGWKVIEACLSLGDSLPESVRAEVARYEHLEEIWHGEMQQPPMWPQSARDGETGGAEQISLLQRGVQAGDDRGQG